MKCGREWVGANNALLGEHRCILMRGHAHLCHCECGASADLGDLEHIYDPRRGSSMLVVYLIIALVIGALFFGAVLFRAIVHGGL